MAKTQTKKEKLPAIQTKEQLMETADDIARLEVKIRQLEARRDAAMQLVRADHDGPIEEAEERMKKLTGLAATYAKAHRDELFTSGSKSIKTALTIIGFRTGNPTLKLLNKKHTWESVLTAVEKIGKYFRTTNTLDKEELQRAKLTDTEYAAFGVRVDAAERFYIESKSDDANRITEQPKEEEP